MDKIKYTKDGEIDWNLNGWPEPNSAADTHEDGYNTDDMPDDIFDIWLEECDNLYEDWGIDG